MNYRLMLVHAHPDDETINTGATMAKYVAAGAAVTLVTCTLGDEGEILLPEFAHLAADREDQLANHRLTELAAAMSELGVTDWQILGGPHKYRDSGMIGTAPNARPDSFWQADLLEAARDLVELIRDRRPQVLVTYDDFGGYGHPDHIKAHRVATYALALASAPSFAPELGAPWQVQKVYWMALPRSVVQQGIAALKAAGDTSEFANFDPDDLPFTCPDELITTVIDGQEFNAQKRAALAAHATQISLDGGFFALSNNLGTEVLGKEYFRRVFGAGPDNETDLFAGVNPE